MKYIPEMMLGLILSAIASYFAIRDYNVSQQTKIESARLQADTFLKYLESSKRKYGAYPAGIQRFNDPWESPYLYSLVNNAPRVCSAGPDGRAGTGDDICVR